MSGRNHHHLHMVRMICSSLPSAAAKNEAYEKVVVDARKAHMQYKNKVDNTLELVSELGFLLDYAFILLQQAFTQSSSTGRRQPLSSL